MCGRLIVLDMIKKIDVRITHKHYTLENGIFTLQIDVGDYDLTNKTITAKFNPKEVETGSLDVIDGIINLPIYSNLLKYGVNYIQLNFRWDENKLEQSPRIMWNISPSLAATEAAQEDVDIISYLISEVNRVVGETGDIKEALDESVANANTIYDILADETTGTIKVATDTRVDLEDTIGAASTAQTNLNDTIGEASTAQTNLNDTIGAASTTQTNLNDKIGEASTTQTNLNDTIGEATTAQTNLNDTIGEASTSKQVLDQAIIDNQIVTLPVFNAHKLDYAEEIYVNSGYAVHVLPPTTGKLPNINTQDKTLTFYSDTTFFVKGKRFNLMNETVVNLSLATSTAKKVYYNIINGEFLVVNYSVTEPTITNKHIFICTIRLHGKVVTCSITSGYTVNGGAPIYLEYRFSKIGFVSGKTINVNTVERTLEIPALTSIYFANKRYLINEKKIVKYDALYPGYKAFALFYDINTNEFVGITQSVLSRDIRPSYVLIGWVDATDVPAWINGSFTINGKFPWDNDQTSVNSAEGRAYIIDNFAADQGMTVVREQIWVFRASNHEHTNYANIEVYDKNTFQHLGAITHNLGHSAACDYCKETDTVVVTTADLTYNNEIVHPEAILITNASNIAVGSQINYSEQLTIKYYIEVDGVVTKALGRAGCIFTFGEAPHILYAHTSMNKNGQDVSGENDVIYKFILGMGSNDFSDSVGNDLTKWGNFISGKSNNEYNGTSKVLKSYVGENLGVNQGICYHEGYVYVAVTSSYVCAEVIKIQLYENGTYKDVQRFKAPSINLNASSPGQEAEGCAIMDGRYLIAGYRGSSGQKLALFPLYNEQGGKGTTGIRINLPFKCNSIPHPQVTPTSTVTDLYIESVDTEGFTVKSTSNGTGTFMWSCRIS